MQSCCNFFKMVTRMTPVLGLCIPFHLSGVNQNLTGIPEYLRVGSPNVYR
jgi:hypothetical protein